MPSYFLSTKQLPGRRLPHLFAKLLGLIFLLEVNSVKCAFAIYNFGLTIAFHYKFHHDISDQNNAKSCLLILDNIGRQVAFPISTLTLCGTAFNKRFAAMLARRNNNGHLGTISYYPADGILFSICYYLQVLLILIGFSCRLDIIKCQHSSKPWTLPAILWKLRVSLASFN